MNFKTVWLRAFAIATVNAFSTEPVVTTSVELLALTGLSAAVPNTTPLPGENVVESNADGADPSAADIAWADAFMAGQPIDTQLHFWTPDFTENDEDSTADSDGENPHTIITALTVNRTHRAFVRAHWRARFAALGQAPAGTPDEEDIAWTNSFLDGEDVDENMIFNWGDLVEPIDGESIDESSNDDNQIEGDLASSVAVPVTSAAPSPLADATPLEKRYISDRQRVKRKIAALHRARRAVRRARRRRRLDNTIKHIVPGPWSGHGRHKHHHGHPPGHGQKHVHRTGKGWGYKPEPPVHRTYHPKPIDRPKWAYTPPLPQFGAPDGHHHHRHHHRPHASHPHQHYEHESPKRQKHPPAGVPCVECEPEGPGAA